MALSDVFEKARLTKERRERDMVQNFTGSKVCGNTKVMIPGKSVTNPIKQRKRIGLSKANETKPTKRKPTQFKKKLYRDRLICIHLMNPDAIANHFYQQGKADAMKTSMEKAKNIDMNPRGTHEDVKPPNGWTVRSIPGSNESTTKLRIKKRK